MQISPLRHDENVLELEAQIIATQSFNNATIEWKYPQQAQLLSGHMNQTVDIASGESKTIRIQLDRSKLKDNDKIFLFVYKEVGGEKHGGSHNFVVPSLDGDEEKEFILKKQTQKKKIIE